jgi:hypothetical protein
MKYRIIKQNGVYKVQEKGLFTLFRWQTWSSYGGRFGNEDYKYNSVEEAEKAIEKYSSGEGYQVVKEL